MIGSRNRNSLPSKEELNEIQQFLLEVAEDLIVRKKEINLYPLDLLEVAKQKSEYPELELFQNITELYRNKWIVPGEDQLKDQVLDLLLHQEIYNYIIKHPGSDTADIMRDLSISFRYALKNLETLFIFGFIRARKYSQYFLYFPYYMLEEEEDMIFCVTRSRMTREILKFFIKMNMPVNAYEIAQALNKKEITIQRKLTRLVQYQIVELVQVGMRTKYKIKKMDRKTFLAILARYGETLNTD